MATEKITKAMVLDIIKEKWTDEETRALVEEYCANEHALIEKKAVKAKERAAAKKVAGDELREVIASLLTTEPQTADEIAAKIAVAEGEDPVTRGKVVPRMTQLIELGLASKTEVSVDGKKRTAYTLPVDAE